MTTERPPGFLNTLSGRTVVLCVLVAIVAAVVSIAVSIPLINGAARTQALATLGRLGDVTVDALQNAASPDTRQRLNDLLASQNVSPFLIGPGSGPVQGLSQETAAAIIAGQDVATTVSVGGTDYFMVGRPLGSGFGLVLLAPAESAVEPASDGLRRLIVALLIGVVVAIVIGYWASRRVTRPLREAARTAERLSAGERDVRVDPEGPAEVADIARSLNELSAALAGSEGRQREFLLSVSHELRTPLTAIRGYAEAMADGLVATGDVAATAAVMESEADRLDRLVADLLDLARFGAVDFTINPVDLDLTGLARQAAEVWQSRCEREGVEFRTEIPGRPLMVRTDPLRARQIIDNLAENALRVTPAGRPIVLAVGRAGSQAMVSVRDGGPGLTVADQQVAFEPAALYSRYRGLRTVGSGVGLALVGRLAHRLGGGAEVSAAPEGGAAFTVRLPMLLPLGEHGQA